MKVPVLLKIGTHEADKLVAEGRLVVIPLRTLQFLYKLSDEEMVEELASGRLVAVVLHDESQPKPDTSQMTPSERLDASYVRRQDQLSWEIATKRVPVS